MQYRYRKVNDISEIVVEDAMIEIAENLLPDGQSQGAIQLVAYEQAGMEDMCD